MCAVNVGPDEPIRLRVSQLSASMLTLAVVVVEGFVQDRWGTVVVGVAPLLVVCSFLLVSDGIKYSDSLVLLLC